MIENLEKAVSSIASDVKDINKKMTYFLENYREDYYRALDGYNKQY